MAQFLGFGDGHDSTCPIGGTLNSYISMTGTSGSTTVTTSLSVNVGDMVLLQESRGTNVGQWEVVTVGSTGAGKFTSVQELDNTYTDSGASQGQAVLIPQYAGGAFSSTVTATDWAGNVGGITFICCSGKLLVSGSINGNGNGYRGGVASSGTGHSDTLDVYGQCGEGTTGDRTQQHQNQGNGGGGGANNRGPSGGCGSEPGGSGGNGVAGVKTGAGGCPGNAGAASGSADLTTMTFGGAGGASGCDWPTGNTGGIGGDGGGIIVIFARELEITGSIVSNGNVGGAGSGPNSNDGGSGGAGGSILIKTQTAVLGVNKITATGGVGGAGSGSGTTGGTGAVGRIRIESCSYTGSASSPAPSYSTGGHDFCGLMGGIV